jgi:hypothetical protein
MALKVMCSLLFVAGCFALIASSQARTVTVVVPRSGCKLVPVSERENESAMYSVISSFVYRYDAANNSSTDSIALGFQANGFEV